MQPANGQGHEHQMHMATAAKVFFLAFCTISILAPVAKAQIVGQRPFIAPEPVELGWVETATGDLHLETPLGSFPQRGFNGQPMTFKLVYDSSVWTISSTDVWVPQSNQLNGSGSLNGWWFQSFGSWGFNDTLQTSSCGNKYNNFEWTDPSGIEHFFAITTQTSTGQCNGWQAISSGSAYATDSSGYLMNVTNYQDFVVYAPDGTKVFSIPYDQADSNGHLPVTKDSNGNYLSQISTNGTPYYFDTTGRAALQVNTTTCGSGVCYLVSNSQNAYSQYEVSYALISVKTAFGEPGVTECITNCTMEVIQSIALPDGTSYTFQYDCDSSTGNAACGSPAGQSAYYGLLTAMTLPTGGQIAYTYSTFFDSYGNANRWLTSRLSAGGMTYYTPAVVSRCGSGQVGCQESLTVKKPSFDTTVYTFTLNNGVWPTQIQSYDSSGNLLATTTNTWDFSNSCPLSNCVGASYVRKTAETLSVPVPTGTITKQTQYTYDSPQTGNITAIKEWAFYPGTSPSFPTVPDRARYITYFDVGGTNIINRPFSITVCNNSGSDSYCTGGGNQVAQQFTWYDTETLKSASGFSNHDDQNFGTTATARGNPTQASNWVTGANQATQYLTTFAYYDTTGQVYQAADPIGSIFKYAYLDNFFIDAGSTSSPQSYSSPQLTNAYLTSVVLPLIGTENFGYYYGSGKRASYTDPNNATEYAHFFDPLDRATSTIYPIGWSLKAYTSVTQTDEYAGVGDTSPSTGCSSCQHTQTILDSFGRKTSEKLVNDPIGTVGIDTFYDVNGRVDSVSHPHTGASGVSEGFSYDGLDRAATNTHPDGQYVQRVFGAVVGQAGGLQAQQGSPTTYGYAYPVLSFDESGKEKEEWIDGFGRIVEVDLPGTQPTGAHASGTVTISGGEESNTRNPCMPKGNCPITTYDAGVITITVNGFSVSTGYNKPSTISSLVSALAADLNVDASPVTATINGGVITLTSKATGTTSNYSLSASRVSYDEMGSFPTTASGSTLTGGTGSETSTFGTPLVTLYTYNALDEITEVLQGSQTRSYAYDGLGRRTSATIPESGTTNVFYATSSGTLCSGSPRNVCRKTDAKGVSTTYTYDALDRLTSKTYSDGSTPTVTYSYDQGGAAALALGRRTQMTDGSGSETYTYDTDGRITKLTKVVGTASYAISYQYNVAGEITQITYPSGRAIQQNYDPVGELCEVAPPTGAQCGSSSTPYANAYAYNAAGQLTSFSYGNGIAATFGFSPNRSELVSLSYAKGSQTLFSLNYFYQTDSTNCPNSPAGNNGQIQCITDAVDSGRTVSYGYDPLGRVSSAVTNGSTNYPKWGLAWTYDQYNNRTSQSVTTGNAPASSLTFVNNQPSGYTYDLNGNLTVEPLSPPNNYGYDAENDMVSYQGTNGSATYTYDGNGVRVKEGRAGGVTTVYIFSGATDIAEYDNNAAPSTPSREYIYSGRSLLAQVSKGATDYFQQDHLSVRLITDSSGNVLGQQGHFPFGEAWYDSNGTTNWVFSTYNRDTGESGLDYAIFRFYNSRTASFCSVDPLDGRPSDPFSWNRYPYVYNDPVNLNDPTGQGLFDWLVRIFQAILDLFLFFSGAPPIVPITPPTFGGGLDPFTLIPGYNPHAAMTPPIIAPSTAAALASSTPGASDSDPEAQATANKPTGKEGSAPSEGEWIKWVSREGPKTLKTFHTDSKDCLTDLKNLGLSVASVQSFAGQVRMVNIMTNRDYFNNWPYGESIDMATDSKAKTPTIAFDSFNKWQKTFGEVLGSLVHEYAHLQNPSSGDTGLQTSLGLPTSSNTTNISLKLAKDCFPGVKNP